MTEPKRGRGRPPNPVARRRVVTVKLTDEEYDRVSSAAAGEQITLTEWLRAAAELALARGSTR